MAAIVIQYTIPKENVETLLDLLLELGQTPEYLASGADVAGLVVSGRPDLAAGRVTL